jgi:parvulin-like peptidyl-prolyl isomerase
MAKKVRTRKPAAKKVIVEETVMMMETSRPKVRLPKKLFVYTVILLVVLGGIYFGKKTFFAASVNGQLVSRLSVIRDLEKQGGKKVLDTIILKTLINQEAQKRKLSLSKSEIDAELQKIEVNVSSQGSTLDALLAQQGMTRDDLVSEIKLQLLVTKMVNSNIKVTDKEIDNYLSLQAGQNSSGLESTPTLSRVQAESAVRQQKLQSEIQSFVADLKSKAKITYFINY